MNRHGGIREEGVLDYSVNINPLGMPQWIPTEMGRLLLEADTYPPILAENAVEALALHLKEPKERLLLGNGATELLYLFARAQIPGRVLLVEPTFNEYRRAFQVAGWDVRHFLREKDTWELDVDALISHLSEHCPRVLVLCEPNNPTSTMVEKESMERIQGVCRENNITLFLDESFLDFTGEPLPAHQEGVVRLRSMTKFYSIAGIRLGYVLADKQCIQEMIAYKEPWSVNTFAQGILPKLLEDEDFRARSLRYIEEQRDYLFKELSALGLHVPPPKANFLFFRCESEGFHQQMYERGFFLRSCEDFYSLDNMYFRMCVRTIEDNHSLVQAMKEVLS